MKTQQPTKEIKRFIEALDVLEQTDWYIIVDNSKRPKKELAKEDLKRFKEKFGKDVDFTKTETIHMKTFRVILIPSEP